MEPTTIRKLVLDVYPAFGMLAAAKLGLFTALSLGPTTVDGVAGRLGVEPVRLVQRHLRRRAGGRSHGPVGRGEVAPASPWPAIGAAAVRPAAAMIVVALAAAILLRAPMFPAASSATGEALAMFRIAFAVLLIVRLHRLRDARLVLWPRSRAFRFDRWLGVTRVISLWQACALLLGAGLATPIAAAGCLVCGLYVFERSYTHSLEDVLFQVNSCFLIIERSPISI